MNFASLTGAAVMMAAAQAVIKAIFGLRHFLQLNQQEHSI